MNNDIQSKKGNKMKQSIKEIATKANAAAWKQDEEKFVFCINLLDVSAWDDNCDELVDELEAAFEVLNAYYELNAAWETALNENKEALETGISSPAYYNDLTYKSDELQGQMQEMEIEHQELLIG